MGFDQSTRNRLARFIAKTRSLLAEEFTRQLQSDFGMDPGSGDMAELDRLGNLNDADRETALLLRETLHHYAAQADTGTPAKAKKARQDALERIVREQAFTILNRLCALRMSEARGLLIESIAKGHRSQGFQLYQRLAGTALGETGSCYRAFLNSISDEFAEDLGILFDRFSPMGRLFPKEACLQLVLDEIDHPDLEPLWAEDETIGWIYQYYNDPDERRQMRKASATPRNSRELAVRNQFFTPRYVVEFLTDNTLGRTWYEMRRGRTRLTEQCRFLVRPPTEVFLDEGVEPPDAHSREGLTQPELLQQPVHIAHRATKDPREIRLLDPACGSMHFGIYAFELFETIYDEAWDDEACAALRDDYDSRDALLRDVPRLIIESNLHGIDIDSRAVQIAGLSLWLRAQKAWQEQAVKAADRPRVRRTNVVCAEPMPGSVERLEHFTDTLKPALLGELVRAVFEGMQLAGEAGSLLRIEQETVAALETAHSAWQQLEARPSELFPVEELNKVTQQREMSLLERALVADHGSLGADFWDTVEQRVFDALRSYAEQATEDTYQRRLFVDDAARGFAFIDLCRKRYDAVVMNPPFGSFSRPWRASARDAYPDSANDMLGAFVERFLDRLVDRGLLGAITSRTCFFLKSFAGWRKNVVLKGSAVQVLADLGQGVMDDAMVEAAAYVLEKTRPSSNITVFRAIADSNREETLEACLAAYRSGDPEQRMFLAQQGDFDLLQDSPFVYWVDGETLRQFQTGEAFEPDCGSVRQGLATGDDFRFVRATWEARHEDTVFCYYPSNGDLSCSLDDPLVQAYYRRRDRGCAKWAFHVKSGASQPWYSPITLKINWQGDGVELRNFRNESGKLRSRPQNLIFFYRPGFSWTLRAVRFYPYAIPSNCIPSVSRYMAFPDHGVQTEALVICASRIASAYLRFYAEFWQRPKYLVDTVKGMPWPVVTEASKRRFEAEVTRAVKQRRLAYQNHEPFHEFVLPGKIRDLSEGGQSLRFDTASLLDETTERMVASAFGLSEVQAKAVERDLLEAVTYQRLGGGEALESSEEGEPGAASSEEEADFVLDYTDAAVEEAHLSYLLGCAFGRWDIRYATGTQELPKLTEPFDPLPVCPPGMLQGPEGLPAQARDVSSGYSLKVSWQGILVDDEQHPDDIVTRVREALEAIWHEEAEAVEQNACRVLGARSLRDYFRRPSSFFADHLKRYTKSHRKAPIYWPLSTSSGTYTVWLYYDRLGDQTLYSCVNDFVDPKLKQVSEEVRRLRQQTNRSSAEERDLERKSDLESELVDFRDEVLRVASFWTPELNDGVQITAAPLWRLFQLRTWRTALKETWERLESGDYDWAHLALSVWPERVVRESHSDLSYAIAHSLEGDLWDQVETRRGRQRRTRYERVPKELSEDELAAIVEEVRGR